MNAHINYDLPIGVRLPGARGQGERVWPKPTAHAGHPHQPVLRGPHRARSIDAWTTGDHSRYIEPREFDRLAARRASRDRAAGFDRTPKGRPSENRLLEVVVPL